MFRGLESRMGEEARATCHCKLQLSIRWSAAAVVKSKMNESGRRVYTGLLDYSERVSLPAISSRQRGASEWRTTSAAGIDCKHTGAGIHSMLALIGLCFITPGPFSACHLRPRPPRPSINWLSRLATCNRVSPRVLPSSPTSPAPTPAAPETQMTIYRHVRTLTCRIHATPLQT